MDERDDDPLFAELKSLGDPEPEPERETVQFGETAAYLRDQGFFDGLVREHEIERGLAQEEARTKSAEGLLGQWDRLDDKGREEWIKGERDAAKSSESFWSGIYQRISGARKALPPLETLPPQFGFAPAAGRTLGWAERKAGEQVAQARRRQLLADEMEQGKREAARIGTTRNILEQFGRGLLETGVGGTIAGFGRGLEYATDVPRFEGDGLAAKAANTLSSVVAAHPVRQGVRAAGHAYRAIGNWIAAKAREMFPGDEARQEEFSSKLANGAGTMVAFMGPTLTTVALTRAGPKTLSLIASDPKEFAAFAAKRQAVATGTAGGIGGLMQAESAAQQAERAKAAGRPVTEAGVRAAYLLNLPVGATEAVPISRLFANPTGSFVKGIFDQAVEEGGQEWVQTVLENVIAQQIYDPDRKWDDGAWEAGAIGAILGGKMEAIRAGYGAARERLTGEEAAPAGSQAVAALPGGEEPERGGGAVAGPELPAEIAAYIRATNPDLASRYGLLEPADQAARDVAGAISEAIAPRPNRIVTPDASMEVEAIPEVVELDDLRLASGVLQPRDRSRAESAIGVRERAASLDPARLQPSRVSDQGAPIISADGTVISGNGRVMSIAQVYRDPALKAQADRYRQSLGPAAEGMREPVLVQRLGPDIAQADLERLADLSNRPAVAQMSATERAQRDARAAGPDIMGLYVGGSFTAPQNREFFRAFADQVVGSAERGAFSREGLLTKEGEDRMAAAVLAAAYGDTDLLSRMLESTDDNIRSITGALRDAAGAFIRLKQAIASGEASIRFDITPQIVETAKRIADLRERNIKPAEFLAQQDAFAQVDPIVESLLRAFYNDTLSRQLSREKLTEVLIFYADEAQKHSDSGIIPDETGPADIIRIARERTLQSERIAEALARDQGDIFASRPSAAGRGDAGTGAEVRGQGARGSRQPARAEGDYDRFRALLASTAKRNTWARQLGISETDLKPLIDQAVEEGLLRVNRNGVVRRTARAKEIVSGERPAQAEGPPPSQPSVPVEAGRETEAGPQAAQPAQRQGDFEAAGKVKPVSVNQRTSPRIAPQAASPLTLTIPADVRIERLVSQRETALGRPIPQAVVDYAVQLSDALGTRAFVSILDDIRADRSMLKADLHDLAAIMGSPVARSATKEAAFKALSARNKEALRQQKEVDEFLAAIGAPGALGRILQAIDAKIRRGESVKIPQRVINDVHAVVDQFAPLIPAGITTGVLSNIQPISGGHVLATFEDRHGGVVAVPMPWAQLHGTRSFFFDRHNLIGISRLLPRDFASQLERPETAGADRAGEGRNFGVGTFAAQQPGKVGVFENGVAAELLHEITHSYRRSGRLSGGVWDRLLERGRALRLLDGQFGTYLRAVGDPFWDQAPDVTTREVYEEVYRRIYPDPADFQEAMDQEEVTHMVEWWVRGLLNPEDVADVRDIIDAILAGQITVFPPRQQLRERLLRGQPMFAFGGLVAAETLAKARQPAAKQAIEIAERLERAGASREAIWKATADYLREADPELIGVFRGADGLWRIEIDDSGAQISRWRRRGPLRSIMKHPKLFAAYPDLARIPVRPNRGASAIMAGADYQERGKGLFGGWRQREEIRTSPIIDAIDPEGRLGRVLHETEHAIGRREGFARGASQDEYSYRDGFDDRKHPRYDHARAAITAFADEMMRRDGLDPRMPEVDYTDANTADVVAAIDRKIAWEKTRAEYERKAHDVLNDLAYLRSAGEVEARNVPRRLNMTAEQRRAIPPWMTEDFPPERQLIQRWGELSPVPTREDVGTVEILPPARVTTSAQGSEKGRIASAAAATGGAGNEPSSQVRGPGEDEVLFAIGGRPRRAFSTSDSIKSTTIRAPAELFQWLGIEPRLFQASYETLAAKRKERPSVGVDLSDPAVVREVVEGVLTDAEFAYRIPPTKHAQPVNTWNLVARDADNRVVGVRLEPSGGGQGVYHIRTVLAAPDLQIGNGLANAFGAFGADGIKWKGPSGAALVHGLMPGSVASPNPSMKNFIKTLRRAQLEGDDFQAAIGSRIPPLPMGSTFATGLDKPSQSLSDLVGELTDALGLTTRIGRLDPSLKAEARAQGGELMGQFGIVSGVARIKLPNDLQVLAHEGGHALEVRPSIRAEIDALKINHASELSANLPDLSEGFAEFFRLYVTNPQAARAQFPGTFQDFEDILDANEPAMLEALEAIQNGVAELANASPAGAVMSRVQSTAVPSGFAALRQELSDEGLVPTIRDRIYAFYRGAFDTHHGVKTAVKYLLKVAERNLARPLDPREKIVLKAIDDPYKLIRLAEHSKVHATAVLQNGVTLKGNDLPSGPSFWDALKAAFGGTARNAWNEEMAQRFGSYLITRRMLAEFARYDAGQLETMPDALIERAVWEKARADLETAHPEFDAAANILYAFNRNHLTLKWQNGFLSDDLYQDLLSRPDYVPLNRIMEKKPSLMSRLRGQNKSDMIRKFRGSQRDFINPLESIVQDVYATQARIAQNDVIRALDRLARAAGPGGGAIAERIPATDMKGTRVDIREALKAAAREAGFASQDLAPIIDAVDDLFDQNASANIFRATATNERGEPIVYLWEKGERVPIRLGDDRIGRDIFESFVGLGQNNSDVIIDFLALGAQALRFGVTKDPAYIVTNLLRDQFATWILSPDFTPFVTAAKGAKGFRADSDLAKRYARFAGLMGGIESALIEEVGKRDVLSLRRKGFFGTPAKGRVGAIYQTILRTAEISEALTRYGHYDAAYKRALADGFTPEEAAIEAAYSAHDVMDFSRRGAKVGIYARITAFLNAALQGLDAARRTATGERDVYSDYRELVTPYLKAATGSPLSVADKQKLPNSARFWVKMGIVGLFGAALAALYRDDEEAEEFNDYMRATHWFFKVGGIWWRYPKPFELAAVSNLFEAAFDRIWKEDPRAYEKFLDSLAHTMVPPNQPNLVRFIYEELTGVDLFSGRQIVPDELKKLPPEMQFNAYTSELARAIGQITGLSPARVDHIMSGLFGTLGRDVMTLSDYAIPRLTGRPPRAEKSPEDYWFLSRLTRRPARGSLSNQEFWEQMSQSGGAFIQVAEGYKALLRAGNLRTARDLLDQFPDEQRAYALLGGHFKEGEQDLHPLNRARQVKAVATSMMRDMVLGRLIKEKSAKPGAYRDPDRYKPEPIVLSPSVQKTVNEILEDISMREARNALIVIGHPGWAQKKITPVDALYAELKAAAPEVAEEFEYRLTTGDNKVYSFEAVRDLWPQARGRLLRDYEDARLYDLKAKAATFKLFPEQARNFGVMVPGLGDDRLQAIVPFAAPVGSATPPMQ